MKPQAKKNELLNKVKEPLAIYKPIKTTPQLKDLTYEEFKKTADKLPFTQAEWAAILHISERTLQRYAKNNGKFASINAERFHQISQVFAKGKKVLGKTPGFMNGYIPIHLLWKEIFLLILSLHTMAFKKYLPN